MRLHRDRKKWVGLFCVAMLLMPFMTLQDSLAVDQSIKHNKSDQQPSKKPSATNGSALKYRALNWDELIPEDWDPMAAIKGIDFAKLDDADPRATEALEKLRMAWDVAPVVESLNNSRIEIPGFVVPLDTNSQNVREFLLVPYHGACIHVPPPPSNQVIHVVVPAKLDANERKTLQTAAYTYGSISVSGVLKAVSTNTDMAASGYQLNAEKIAAYKSPTR